MKLLNIKKIIIKLHLKKTRFLIKPVFEYYF